MVWESAATAGADTHIRGRFYDVIGGPDAFTPNAVNLSDGIGIESNAVIVSGGANSGWGIAWEELDALGTGDTTHTLRTNFMGPGQLTASEQDVWTEANTVDQHDIAMSRGILDRTLASPVGGSVLPTGMNEGYNVAWVSTDATLNPDGLSAADIANGYGRVMMQRFEVPLDPLGNPGAPAGAGQDGIFGEGSDAAFRVSNAIGRDPSTAALHSFETGVIWIEKDALGVEHVKGTAYDDLGQTIPGFDNLDISGAFPVAAGTTAHIAAAAAVNFGVVWVTQSAPGVFTVMGTMYASNGAGLDGVGFGFAAPPPFALFDLPAGANPADLQMSMTGISGEDSADLIVSWKVTNAGNIDVMAQHIKVALDPSTGVVLAMASEGNSVTVNADTTGTQDGGTVAGMLGDRFITVYHDTNSGDGNDIVARIMDTRNQVSPDPIVGDLVQPAGGVQARRDVLVGTNGDDNIRGDILDNLGLVDFIYAGMGDDTVQGGPGLRGAAGVPELIYGGEGFDTAVYTGRLQDYSITVNGDGSYEIIDLRPVQDAAGVLQPTTVSTISTTSRTSSSSTSTTPAPARRPLPSASPARRRR